MLHKIVNVTISRCVRGVVCADRSSLAKSDAYTRLSRVRGFRNGKIENNMLPPRACTCVRATRPIMRQLAACIYLTDSEMIVVVLSNRIIVRRAN